jgi:hypothetical protein
MPRFSVSAPPVDAAPVKRLGEPPFRLSRPGFLPEMETIYRAIAASAMALTLEK